MFSRFLFFLYFFTCLKENDREWVGGVWPILVFLGFFKLDKTTI